MIQPIIILKIMTPVHFFMLQKIPVFKSKGVFYNTYYWFIPPDLNIDKIETVNSVIQI